MLDVKTRLTYADYLKTSDDERYELLNGELIMSPSPKEIHQYISGNLYFVLGAFVRERSLGRGYFSPFDVVLSDTDVVQPDLLFVSNERADIITPDNIQGRAPTWWSRSSPPPQPSATGRSNSICTPSTA